MKVVIEVEEGLSEECIIIRCQRLDENIIKLQNLLAEQTKGGRDILLYKGEKSYYIPLDELLFFETENKQIWAHTAKEMYETDYKLYELEELLPGHFMRISKSTIVNLEHIYSITKNIASSSIVEFSGCHKQIYVSRNYYKALISRLDEKRKIKK
ncbi:MAG: LytTR family transcriptional regulator [Lachnospiraceae bacterium]|nr:LytTR family transcriptional regulator [Lachnospiraceae bacterium]